MATGGEENDGIIALHYTSYVKFNASQADSCLVHTKQVQVRQDATVVVGRGNKEVWNATRSKEWACRRASLSSKDRRMNREKDRVGHLRRRTRVAGRRIWPSGLERQRHS